MKNVGFVFLLSFVFYISCNDTSETVVTSDKEKPTEKELISEMEKYPDSLLLTQNLIEYYRNLGNYNSAIAVTDKAIKKDPNIAELWDIKATLYYENNDTLSAINAFENAINIIPLPEYVISLGSLYAQTKNVKALELADALLLADKAKAEKEAFFIKGLYYNYTGDKIKAINLFDSCIRLDHTYMFAYREKGIALYEMAKYEEAVKVLTRAVTIQNSFDEGYYWLGNCFKKLNKKQEAIESYQTALMYDKNFIEARDSLKTLQ